MKYLAFVMCLLIGTMASYAHSGGTNAQGCHSGSKPYHCHGSKSKSTYKSTSSSSNLQLYKTKFFKCEKKMNELEESNKDKDDTIEFLESVIDQLSVENADMKDKLIGE